MAMTIAVSYQDRADDLGQIPWAGFGEVAPELVRNLEVDLPKAGTGMWEKDEDADEDDDGRRPLAMRSLDGPLLIQGGLPGFISISPSSSLRRRFTQFFWFWS
jgi:hypothetical protein